MGDCSLVSATVPQAREQPQATPVVYAAVQAALSMAAEVELAAPLQTAAQEERALRPVAVPPAVQADRQHCAVAPVGALPLAVHAPWPWPRESQPNASWRTSGACRISPTCQADRSENWTAGRRCIHGLPECVYKDPEQTVDSYDVGRDSAPDSDCSGQRHPIHAAYWPRPNGTGSLGKCSPPNTEDAEAAWAFGCAA